MASIELFIVVYSYPTMNKDTELIDIMFETTPANFYSFCRGSNEGADALNIKMYSMENSAEALADAERRLAAVKDR